MNADELIEYMEKRKKQIEALKTYWASVFPTEIPTPNDSQLNYWLNACGGVDRFDALTYSISETSKKAAQLDRAGQPMTPTHSVRYVSKIVNIQAPPIFRRRPPKPTEQKAA
jgi:hypothetical protein